MPPHWQLPSSFLWWLVSVVMWGDDGVKRCQCLEGYTYIGILIEFIWILFVYYKDIFQRGLIDSVESLKRNR